MSGVQVIAVNLDDIDHTQCFQIGKRVIEEIGGPVTVNKVTSLGIKIRRMSPGTTGNHHTAKWRRRHGGGWRSPLNAKFK